MQSVSLKHHISLLFLVLFFIIQAWGQCVPPAQLDPFQCASCNEIRIFYCENEPQPTSLPVYLQQNNTYQLGTTFAWYADQNGVQDILLSAEPSINFAYSHSEYYWVSQTLAGCASSAIRVHVTVRGTPRLTVSDSIGFCYPYQMDVAGQVVDRKSITSSFQYFDADPLGGAYPFRTLTASGGTLVPASQSIFAAPPNPKTYWIIGANEGSYNSCTDTVSFTIVPYAIPQLNLGPDIVACSGDMVSVSPVQTTPAPTLIFWRNNNIHIGLGDYGFGNVPAFQTPSGLTQSDTAILSYYVLSGVCAAIDSIKIIIQPKPAITSGLMDTVCSRENALLSLSISNPLPGITSYQWNAPVLASDLQGNAMGGSSHAIQDAFVNKTSGLLTAQYEVIATSAIGCKSLPETVTVAVKPEPIISSFLGKDICSSQPAQLSFNTQNQLSNVLYNWTGGTLPVGLNSLNGSPSTGTGPQLQDAFLNSGNSALSVGYQLQAEADGCLAIPQNFTLSIHPVQSLGPLQLLRCEDSPGQAIFDLHDVNLQISSSPANSFYLDSELTQTITSPQSFLSGGQTIYAVRSGSAPCPESWAVLLQVQSLPASPATIQDEGCQGTLFSIAPTNGIGSSFNFYGGNSSNGNAQLLGSQVASFDTLLIIPNQTIEIWMTSFDGLCESPATLASILVKPIPYIFYFGSNTPLCVGDDLKITPNTSPAQSFTWTSTDPSFSSNDSVLRVQNMSLSQAGMYYLTILNDKACQYVDSVHVQVVPAPHPGTDSVVNFCHGDPIFNLFDALGPGVSTSGFWTGPSLVTSGNLGTFNSRYMSFGIYTYNLAGHVCQSSKFAKVEIAYFPIPTPTISVNNPIYEGDDLTLLATDGISYLWSGANGFSAIGALVTRPAITLADSGYYNVKVTNAGGCVGYKRVVIKVKEIPRTSFEFGAWLEGPYDANTGLMWDSIRTLGAIPLIEPFTAMNFNMVGGGGESINPSVLQVSGPNAIVDWIFVDLRDPNDSMLTLASRACLLQRDGDVVDLDGVSDPDFQFLPDGFYYVVLDHRNHLSIMTGMPVYFSKTSSTSIDFRDANLPLFGFNPSKVIGNQGFLFSGDANGDDQVQVVDLVNFWVKNVGASGYQQADWNMDGQVQNIDFINYWIPNAGRGSQVPGKAL